MAITDIRQIESINDWALRLYENARAYGIDCSDIADLLNAKTGQNKTESAWRKYYKAFREGIQYEKNRVNSRVKHRLLVLSDFHYPFAKPIETFAEYRGCVDTLVLNGDILDCQALSKFTKTYRISPIEEMIGARAYLIQLIEYLQPKRVVATYGNHEIRLGKFLADNLGNELQELLPETALDYIFDDGIPYYNRETHSKVFYEPLSRVFPELDITYSHNWWWQDEDSGVIVCHPKAFSSSPMKTAERATNYFRNEGLMFRALVMAHTHRLGSYKIGNTMIYEQGCLCETKKMNYSDGLLVNAQKEGFLWLCLDENGEVVEEATSLKALN